MALLPTNKDKKIGAVDISIKDDIQIELGEKSIQQKNKKLYKEILQFEKQ